MILGSWAATLLSFSGSRRRALAVVLSSLALAGCRGEASVVDYCVAHEDACPPCASSAECRFGGNACNDTVYCAHRDASIAVIQLGCEASAEYSWPEAEECGCVAGVCRSVP